MAKVQPAFSWINWADLSGVTFTPSAEIVTLPASNLADPDIAQVWGVDGLAPAATQFHVDIDLLESSAIGVIAFVLGWRRDSTDKIRETPMMAPTDKMQIYIDDGVTAFGTGGVLDSGEVDCNINPHIGYHVFAPPAPVNGQRIRIRFDAVSRASEGFWWGARAWIGPLKKMLRGHQFGHTEKWGENAFEEVVRAPSIPFQHVKDVATELAEMKEFEQLTTTKQDFLFIRDVNNPHETSLIGKRKDTAGFQSSYFRNYGFTLQMEENW